MPRLWLGVCAALLMPAAAWAQGTAPEIRQFDIPTLEKLGHDMYVQDQAAWRATDALTAQHPQADLIAEKVHGWIVEARPAGQLVRFIRDGDAGPEAAYDINMAGEKPAVSVPLDRVLSDSEKAQYSARSLAIKSITQRCGDNYNTIVLKDPEGGGWLAWALAATTNPNLVMAGGHRRLTVSADGSQILHNDALSRSCLMLDKKPTDESKNKMVALMSTQIVSDIPVETFVFLSLQHRLPFVVLTPDRTEWAVEGETIRKLGTLPEKKAP